MIPLTTALNLQSGVANAAMTPIPASGGGLIDKIFSGLSGAAGLFGGGSDMLAAIPGIAAGLSGGSGMFGGGGMESSSATTTSYFQSGDFNIGGSNQSLYVIGGIAILLIILVLAKGK